MKIQISDNFSNIDQLEEKLHNALQNYTFSRKGKYILIAKKSALIATVIIIKKKKLQVSGNFPEFYYSLIFALITVALGVIVPVVLYFVFIHRKFNKSEKEVVAALSLIDT